MERFSACEEALEGEDHKIELAKKAIIMKGRDNTRIPIPVSGNQILQGHDLMSNLQWTDDPHGGFCSPTAKPWIPALDLGREWCGAHQQSCPESVWSFYQSIIKMRKAHPTLVSVN